MIPEIIQWNEPKTCVPFTSQPEFPEFLGNLENAPYVILENKSLSHWFKNLYIHHQRGYVTLFSGAWVKSLVDHEFKTQKW